MTTIRSSLIRGNALHIPLADNSVHCVVTSPPYWAMRSYVGTATWLGGDPLCDHSPGSESRVSGSTLTGGKATTGHKQEPYRDVCRKCGAQRVDQQLGLEPLHDCLAWARGEPPCGACYVCNMRAVFAEVRRVLRPDGSLWLNLGDGYSNIGKNGGHSYGKNYTSADGGYQAARNMQKEPAGLKPKDMVGVPWRVALALQADGWFLRSEIIWAKVAPMPESVTDRPSRAHEQIFLLTKSPRYYYDQEAISEPIAHATIARTQTGAPPRMGGKKYGDHPGDDHRTKSGNEYQVGPTARRNSRTVWELGPEGFSGAHFATYPTEIPRRAIKAGTSEYGVCPACGAPWERMIEHGLVATVNAHKNNPIRDRSIFADNNDQGANRNKDGHKSGYTSFNTTTGWRPACTCDAGEPVPALAFDPFNGSGTSGLVAQQLGRRYVGLDLSPDYLKIARERLGLVALEQWQAGDQRAAAPADLSGLPLFGGDS